MNKDSNNSWFEFLLWDFEDKFNTFKEKNIVLYGLGVSSSNVIKRFRDYNIIGVMDRDESKAGEFFFGVPIINKDEAGKRADLIIINTDEVYWEMIFKRIEDLNVPIYFRNGEKASIKESVNDYSNNEYWNVRKEDLINRINESEVVSFDIFDTLITRKTYSPSDVFDLVEKKLKNEFNKDISFSYHRKNAEQNAENDTPSIDEIYLKLGKILNLDKEERELIKKLEFETEESLMVPRLDMVNVLEYCRSIGKTIIIVSDMYYGEKELKLLLNCAGIKVNEKIYVSCEKKKSKHKRDLFWLIKRENKGKRILHIGDNYNDDIVGAKEAGVDSFYIMSPRDMLLNSSMKKISYDICSLQSSVVMGCIIAKLFNSPFSLSDTKGMITMNNPEDIGYSIFGAYITEFLLWLLEDCVENGIKQCLFFSRDGYFLIEHFRYLKRKLGLEDLIEEKYLFTSRKIVGMASIENEKDFMEIAKKQFSGRFLEYMDSRWNVKVLEEDEHKEEYVNTQQDFERIKTYLGSYESQLRESISSERCNYLEYCNRNIKENFAFIDLWFYGHIQYYISKLIQRKSIGYYFVKDESESNINTGINERKSCYNKHEKNAFRIFESIFTAPYGSVKSCKKNGEEFSFEKAGKNQKYFEFREKVNDGVRRFIEDYIEIVRSHDVRMMISGDKEFANKVYGSFLKGGCSFSDDINKKLFFEDSYQGMKEIEIME